MHRVLSGQTSRCIDSSQEFISKKLCISVVFICAFFSLLGGFLMGRYAVERFNSTHDPSANDEKCSKTLNQLSISINKLNSLSKFVSTGNSTVNFRSDINLKLQCGVGLNVTLPSFNSSNDFSLITDRIIDLQLITLQTCYDNVINFMESVLYRY